MKRQWLGMIGLRLVGVYALMEARPEACCSPAMAEVA